MKMRTRWWLRALWLLMVGCVIAGSLLPGRSPAKRAMDDLFRSDKLVHVAAYGMLLLLPGLHEPPLATWFAAAGAASLGIALEFAQTLVGGRNYELGDILANTAGVVCGLAAARLLKPRLGKYVTV